MNPFLNQKNSIMINNNQMMMNDNNQMMMNNNNQMMMNNYNNQMMINNNNQMMMNDNNPMMMNNNNNQMMINNNHIMMNNNPIMMNNNNQMMMNNNNQMMMNNNPMMMNHNQMVMDNNPLMMDNNQIMMDNNQILINFSPTINIKEYSLKESNEDIDINYDNLNEVQKNLINQIIIFYQKYGCFEMNLQNNNQIKQLIKHSVLFIFYKKDEFDEYLDTFNYIKTEKKLIKFIDSNLKIYNINIPIFITKFDLYSIAKLFKIFFSTHILLIHNNKILNKDESSIDEISNNDYVLIIENRLYPDNSSYIFLQNKYPYIDIINLWVYFENGCIRNYRLNKEVKIKEFINMIIKENGLIEKDCIFQSNGTSININEPKTIREFGLYCGSKIFCLLSNMKRLYFGKILKGKTRLNKEKISVSIGTLNKLNILFDELNGYKNFKTITIGNVKLKKDSDNCLFLYGIKENFYFTIDSE